MYSDFYTKYPQVNDEILNLDWVINKIKSMDNMLAQWIEEAEELQQMLLNTIPGMQTDISTLQTAVSAIEANIADLQQIRNSIAALNSKDQDLQNQINNINTDYARIFQMFDEVNARIDRLPQIIGIEFLASIRNVQVELYKAGHHGSETSSSNKLMSKIQPKRVCVCCCAGSSQYTDVKENQFPTQEFINRVAPYTDKIYVTTLCTDYSAGVFESMNGNIVLYCKENEIVIQCSNNNVCLKDTDWFKANRTCPTSWAA